MPKHFAVRIEPLPVPDAQDATRGVVHDPMWFLTRQWQLGELQGENASTPVKATIRTQWRPIVHPHTGANLGVVPPEPLVESELGDWWTIGRRLRLGALIADDLGLSPEAPWLIAHPPPPYDLVQPAWDGRRMWLDPGLAVDPGILPEMPPEPEPAWVADELVYERENAFDAGGVSLHLRRHRGGRIDWYSVDADVPENLGPASSREEYPPVAPARVEYAGMPRTGIWEIEDPQADIGAMAPDAAHTATAIMTKLFFSHRDEWFDVPVPAFAGQLLRIVAVEVVDSFGEAFVAGFDDAGKPTGWPGLHPPTDAIASPHSWHSDLSLPWGLFHTHGLAPGELLLWQAVDRPLTGEIVERVQFGVDDESNVVWAVERRLEQREPQPQVLEGHSLVPPRPSDITRGQAYEYVPSIGAQAHWIPYTIPGEEDPRELRQRRLADLSIHPVGLFDPARAEVLQGEGRTLRESVVPLDGLEVRRRWMLARGADGQPHLWIQRERFPLSSPPARTLRFDVAVPVEPPTS